MADIEQSIKRLVPKYVIRESSSSCSCDLDANCDCMPSLYLTMDGYTGYGSAHWTYTDESCPPDVDDCGKAYWCNFLGMTPFWAMGELDAAEKLLSLLDAAGHCANVNYVNNKRAKALIEELKSK